MPKAAATWAAVPVASTVIRSGVTPSTVIPWLPSHDVTAETAAGLGENRPSHWAGVR